MTKDEGRRLGLWLLPVVLAVAAYHLSVFGVFFLLPLQWVFFRHGERSFWLASVLAAAGIGAVELAVKALTHAPWSLLDAVVLGLPLVLIVGWVAIVAMERLGWRFLYRLAAVTAVAGLVLFPLAVSLLRQEAFALALEKSFAEVWNQAFSSPGLDIPGLKDKMDRSMFFELLKDSFLGSFLLVFFLFWGFTGRVSRAFNPSSVPRTLKDFRVPPQGTWILLVLWGLVLVKFFLATKGIDWKWNEVEYVIANAAFIVLAVHVAAGWGILQSLLDGWKVPRVGQWAVRLLLILLLLTPVAGTWSVLGGLAGLAVLELWVDFRKRTQGVGL